MSLKKLGVVAAFVFFVFVIGSRNLPSRAKLNDPINWHLVTRVIDGDTIEIETGDRVRYIGMNTPETVDPERPIECFGKEASAYNHKLVAGKKVRLVSDVTDKDKYGRLLRYVYLEDGTFVNLKLVEDGYANVMTIPPNVAKAEEFRKAEQSARDAALGLWMSCSRKW